MNFDLPGQRVEGSKGKRQEAEGKRPQGKKAIVDNPWGRLQLAPEKRGLGRLRTKNRVGTGPQHQHHQAQGFFLIFAHGKGLGWKKTLPQVPPEPPPQVCGGSQPGRLRASAGRNPSGRPRPGQGERGRAKVKGRRRRDRKQKRKDRGEQGQHVKSYGRPCMKWGKTRGQQGGAPPDAKGKLG